MTAKTILVVDDEPNNFDVIEGLLSEHNYDLHYTSSGLKALSRLDSLQPDLILLDVMMPDLNGIEVCRRLKAGLWQHIPVIVITALTAKQDLAECLEAGADDFISKPVTGLELRARIQSMLRIKEQYDALNANLKLREELSHALVHDIRNPLASIIFATSILKSTLANQKQQQKLEQISLAAQRLQRFADELLLVAKAEAGSLVLKPESVDFGQLVQQAVIDFEAIAQPKKIHIHYQYNPSPYSIAVDGNLFRRVIDNLLSNAIKFSPSNSTIHVKLDYRATPSPQVTLRIVDEGSGVSQEVRDRIFERYNIGQTMEGVAQLGLGLAFCKMVIDAHQAQISVEDNYPKGSIFTVTIPQGEL
ncbi:hybrid sensor histidine kinase/response regulator [Spirulina sp. CS-785/01]|uniref:hybrid sensor histidine kinase/response regulator n=1 Tax=Spirulina sp. CS-785/01 TaxID=3021716 RepID=UPI00232F2C74|nr:hybrid sensor histidine kinase/response regulator [Spirulina sp. CS-785/01]MDB9313493.1 hybrid sensor histidine kinase/response regulator [Spirulina sp. CS-785/01]